MLAGVEGETGDPGQLSSGAASTLVEVLIGDGKLSEAEQRLDELRPKMATDDYFELRRRIAYGWLREGNLARADSMLGALNAVRSASGTVSLDLRPLAVGRGSYRVEIRLKSGKRSKRFKRTYKVGRTGALPRISASLSKATGTTTVTLTVRKKSGARWGKYAGTRLVLKK